jgi:hypothetical protein
VPQELLAGIREAFAASRYLFTLHAVRQAEEREITARQVKEAVLAMDAEIIEDYPQDRRGPSCLILGTTSDGRVLHVHMSYPPRVWIITVYEPSEDTWIDAKTRR